MPEVLYVPRSEWGSTAATEAFLAARTKRRRAEVTSAHIHHTAAIDTSDATPNRWTYDRARRYVRALQTARPDLMPLPYCDNIAVSEDLRTVWVLEGCGVDTVGAHTGGYNRTGYGIGILGNFDKRDDPARDVLVAAIQFRLSMMRHELGFDNMGERRNPNGWEVFGHRDTSSKSCPGSTLYPRLVTIRFVAAPTTTEEAMFPMFYGEQSSDIAYTQGLLNRLGANLTTDGRYGDATAAAVVQYLDPNGDAGSAINYTGPDGVRRRVEGGQITGNIGHRLTWAVMLTAAKQAATGGGGDKVFGRPVTITPA